MSTFSPMISSLCAPGTSLTLDEYGLTSKTIGAFMISIYVLGYALGPLFLAPLSEMYGRVPVINVSCGFFNAFLLGSSFAPNMPSLILMRLLAGIGGSAVMTITSAVIGDAFRVHERAAASCIIIGTPSLSPVSTSGQTLAEGAGPKLTNLCSRSYCRRIRLPVSWMALGEWVREFCCSMS
jgi:MFS family permease